MRDRTNSRIDNRRKTRFALLFSLAAAAMLLAGCQYTGSLRVQPYNRPLSQSDFFADGRSARNFVAGTVPQTELNSSDPSLTGKDENGNFVTALPVPLTNDLVRRGQERYEIYCMVCHGTDGHGDGQAIAFNFPKPPDLLGDTVKALPDGQVFDVITNGKGNMYSYAYRVKAQDRWAVIAYIRAMQLKNGHLEGDLTADELNQLETAK